MSLLGTLYLAALVVGLGVNLLQFVLAGLGGGDVDHDALAGHGDVGGDVDGTVLDPDGHAAHAAVDAGFLPLVLSGRFWTFGALGFGLLGSLLHFLALAPALVTAALALGAGLSAGFAASSLFRALSRASSQSGALASDALGQVGRVLVPVAPGARGKVRIQLRGQTIDYLATTDDDLIDAGSEVLIAEVRAGGVHVCRAPAEFGGPASTGPGAPSDD